MHRFVGLALLLAACALPLSAQARPVPQSFPTVAVIDSIDPVLPDLKVMAAVSLHFWVEQSRCITSYSFTRQGDTVHISLFKLAPSEVAYADSLNVYFYPTKLATGELAMQLCGDSLPPIHTHLIDNGYHDRESPLDSVALADRPRIPFGIILSVYPDSARLHVYGLKAGSP